jgi:hypothetical protein
MVLPFEVDYVSHQKLITMIKHECLNASEQKHEKSYQFETRFQKRNGTRYWYSATYFFHIGVH